jgi:hypothetical protein
MKTPETFINRIMLPAAVASTLVIAGCTKDEKNADLRVIHASPDAPPVNVQISSRTFNKEISNLDYAASSGYEGIPGGRRDITIEAIVPGGNLEVLSEPGFVFEQGERYNVLAVGRVAEDPGVDGDELNTFVVEESAASPGAGEVAVAVVHASPDAPEVDVYVTAPGTDVSDPNLFPNFTFDFRDPAVDAGALPAAAYDITVTLAGTKTIAYDIADVDLGPFAGQKLLIAAISTATATNKEASPVKLLVATDDAQLVLLDKDTAAGARVVHLSPNADAAAASLGEPDGKVEVIANSLSLGVSGLELIDGFTYTEIAPPVGNPPLPLTTDGSYVLVPPANDFTFDVNVNEGANVFMSGEVPLASGSEYTVIAAGLVGMDPLFGLLPTEDDNRSIATQASVKVVHGAPAAGTVSVYVTPAGQFTTDEIEAAFNSGDDSIQPLLTDFNFGDITDYVPVPPDNYDIRVIPTALGFAAIDVQDQELAAGLVATVIARQPNDAGAPSGTPTDFGLVLLTN